MRTNEAIIDLVETLVTRIERRVQQLQRVARQQHGLALDENQAARVLSNIIEAPMRFEAMLGRDDVADAEVAMLLTITRAKSPALFQHKETTT